MCTKKAKLLFNTLYKGRTGSMIFDCLKGVLAFIAPFVAIILIVSMFVVNAYLLARYTPFYINTENEKHRMAICNSDTNSIDDCVGNGILHSSLLSCAILIIVLVLATRPKNYGRIILLILTETVIILFVINNFVEITKHFNSTLTQLCEYNATIGSYTPECYRALGVTAPLCLLLLIMLLLLIGGLIYEGCDSCRQHIKEDLSTFEMESIKVDN